MTTLFAHVVYAMVASMAYGVLFSVPRTALLASGITGLIGWLGYEALPMAFPMGPMSASVCGSALVAASSEVFARSTRHPATVFIVPGIIPLVPGYAAYETMQLFLAGRIDDGLRLGIQTAFLSGGIAAGLLVVGSLFRAVKHATRHRQRS